MESARLSSILRLSKLRCSNLNDGENGEEEKQHRNDYPRLLTKNISLSLSDLSDRMISLENFLPNNFDDENGDDLDCDVIIRNYKLSPILAENEHLFSTEEIEKVMIVVLFEVMGFLRLSKRIKSGIRSKIIIFVNLFDLLDRLICEFVLIRIRFFLDDLV